MTSSPRSSWLLLAVVFLMASGCARTSPGTAEASSCAQDETPLSRAPFSTAEVEEAMARGAGQLPELMGGLSSVLEKIQVPPGVSTGGERVRVLVEFVVDEAGCPRQLRVLESPDDALSEAVLQAVGQSRFKPGAVDGVLVPIRMELPTSFRTER